MDLLDQDGGSQQRDFNASDGAVDDPRATFPNAREHLPPSTRPLAKRCFIPRHLDPEYVATG
jgi:hypothetical protein